MNNGPLAGFGIDSMRVRLFDGSFHAVDSDQLSFELAAKMGFREAAKKQNQFFLSQSWLEVLTPDEYTGDIVVTLIVAEALCKEWMPKVLVR